VIIAGTPYCPVGEGATPEPGRDYGYAILFVLPLLSASSASHQAKGILAFFAIPLDPMAVLGLSVELAYGQVRLAPGAPRLIGRGEDLLCFRIGPGAIASTPACLACAGDSSFGPFVPWECLFVYVLFACATPGSSFGGQVPSGPCVACAIFRY